MRAYGDNEMQEYIEQAYAILDEAYEKNHTSFSARNNVITYEGPSHIFAMFSGGNDSLCAVHITWQWCIERGLIDKLRIAHINTGIGIEATRQFVRDTTAEWGLPYLEYHAKDNRKADGTPDPQNYTEMVKSHGFPGPVMHTKMYNRLKERQIARLVKEHKQFRRDKIMLCTGIRQQESTRRMAILAPSSCEGAKVWTSPCFWWTKSDLNAYKALHKLPANPVAERLGMSGECLCGAYAKPGELDRIASVAPDVAAEIRALEEEVKGQGFDWGWEGKPTTSYILKSMGMASLYDLLEEAGTAHLCSSCDARHVRELSIAARSLKDE